MSRLIILDHVEVENANAISGLTYGFPAITHFLGYTHALSRKLQHTYGLTLNRCAVICHKQQLHAYQSAGNKVFALTRNPLTEKGTAPSFNEEGRMHMTVSLLIECKGTVAEGDAGAHALAEHLQNLCPQQRLAGGTITRLRGVKVMTFPYGEDEIRNSRRVLRQLMPGFVLLDRSELLLEHFSRLQQKQPQAEMLDAWLDFVVLKKRAVIPENVENAENQLPAIGTPAQWDYVAKPASGYLVPLMTGYRAISEVYAAGEVAKTRDAITPFCFAESVYGIGEWRSLHRINDIHSLLWRYDYQDNGWYLCRSETPAKAEYYADINYD